MNHKVVVIKSILFTMIILRQYYYAFCGLLSMMDGMRFLT